MILSFHPCYVADRNIICAGRAPGPDDLSAIQAADAVILPQGCPQTLYKMARDNCRRVFPDYDVRFGYPGKIGQGRLFKELGVAHPRTLTFSNVRAFLSQHPRWQVSSPMELPFVFKFDWGGEGESVFFIETPEMLTEMMDRAADFEKTGQFGFLLQEYIPTGGRSLRVAVIGQYMVSYWRVIGDPERFCANLAGGGQIDHNADPHLQDRAKTAVRAFCSRTGINLAGFDLIFPAEPEKPEPLFLEINWFFGRRGLGGSERFYDLLTGEIDRWLQRIP